MEKIMKSEFKPLTVKAEEDKKLVYIPNHKGKIYSTMGSMCNDSWNDRYNEHNKYICGVKK